MKSYFRVGVVVVALALLWVGLGAGTTVQASTVPLFDHFSGTVLDGQWVPITSGAGSQTIADSVLTCDSPTVSDACAVYFDSKIEKSENQIWVFALSNKDGSYPQEWLSVLESPGAPSLGTGTSLDPNSRISVEAIQIGSTRGIAFSYFDPNHIKRFWNGSTNSWSTTAALANSPIDANDYYLVGFEVDADTNRWRLLSWGKASPGSFTFNQGLRLFSLTDWVSFSNLESADDLWLVMGDLSTDTHAGTLDVEWVRRDAGEKQHLWTNGRSGGSDKWRIRHGWGYPSVDGGVEMAVFEGRNDLALDTRSGSWEAQLVKDPFVFFDDATNKYYLLYAGANGGYQIGLAENTSPYGTFTRVSTQPLIPAVSGTIEANVFAPGLVKDVAEQDPSKLYKLLYTAFDGQFRVMLATAPAITGPWTKQGVVLGPGQSGAFDQDGYSRPRAIYTDGQWYVFVSAKNNTEAGQPFRVTYATGPSLDNLTPSGVILADIMGDGIAHVTAPISGRIVSVDDTQGFVEDAFIEVDQDGNQNNYGSSRIRKVLDANTLELYHSLKGFGLNTKVVQVDSPNRVEISDVQKFGDTWHMYVTSFDFFGGFGSGYEAYDENTALLTSSDIDGPYTWNYASTPPFTRGSWGTDRSNENLAFVHYAIDTGTSTPDTTPPVISTVSAGNITDSSATITWQTDELSTSQIEYGPTAAYGTMTTLDSLLVTSHSGMLSGLQDDTTYHYRVHSADGAGNPSVSADHTFTTTVTPPADTIAPTRSLGAPNGILPHGTTSATLSLTTDENATCRYDTQSGTSYANQPHTFTTTATTSHSTGVSGLGDGQTYSYYVRCIDISGNANTDDYLIEFSVENTPVDTTDPSVAITAPVDSSIVQGTVNVSASATDDTGVVGVQFKLDGVNLGAEDTTSPYMISWNTLTFSNGSHVLTAEARDAAGNVGASTPVTVTVSNNFALEFDGGNDAASGPVLSPPAQFSVEAWIKPDNLGEGNAGHIFAIRDMGDNNPNIHLRFWSGNKIRLFVLFDNSGSMEIGAWDTPINSIQMGVWNHIVVTYDSTSVINDPAFYINGSPVQASTASRPSSGSSLRSDATVWYVGNNASTAGTFNGMIEEMRVYDRVLAPSEAAAHYNNGVVSEGDPEAGLVAGWHFNENSGLSVADYSGNGHDLTLLNGPVWVTY